MAFFIETFDKPNHMAVRQQYRPSHLMFLDNHKHLLLACGAKLDDEGKDLGGGIYILDVDTRAEAQEFIEQDPFYQANLFKDIKIIRWRKAYIDGICLL